MLRYDPSITQDEFKKMKTPWKCHMSWEWLGFRQISQKTDLLDSLRSNKKIEHNFSLFDIKEFAAKMQQLCGRMCLHITWGGLGLDMGTWPELSAPPSCWGGFDSFGHQRIRLRLQSLRAKVGFKWWMLESSGHSWRCVEQDNIRLQTRD